MTCIDPDEMVEEQIDRVLTQYRESPKFLYLLRTYLKSVSERSQKICNIFQYFDIEKAGGDQLTILGKILGFPRCHCVCDTVEVFGFECLFNTQRFVLSGFCSSTQTWLDCADPGVSEICIDNDDFYRKLLKIRRYQIFALYDWESLTECIQILWGENARIINTREGEVIVTPGRDMTPEEERFMQIIPRVLPTAPGISLKLHLNHPIVFGFGDGWGGFCEKLYEDSNLVTDLNHNISDEGSNNIVTVYPLESTHWMCRFDPKPYECA